MILPFSLRIRKGFAFRVAALAVFAVSILVSGCASTSATAPVIERASAARKLPAKAARKEGDWRPQIYTVQKGDTLYGIALEHGFDYKEVAELNGIVPPYTIRIGQQLKFSTSAQAAVPLKAVAVTEPQSTGEEALLKTQPKAIKQPYTEQVVVASAEPQEKLATPAEKKEDASTTDDEKIDWNWPTAGKVIASFNEASSSGKGLDIGGKGGQPILAAAPGKVVYSGSGLRGYGKLVIIKHNKSYLSAYAHNRQILVKEGQVVTKGQKIAEMGDTDADQVKLHFEIRQFGKPVDPLKYLPQTGEASSSASDIPGSKRDSKSL